MEVAIDFFVELSVARPEKLILNHPAQNQETQQRLWSLLYIGHTSRWAKKILNEQSTKRHPYRHCWGASSVIELLDYQKPPRPCDPLRARSAAADHIGDPICHLKHREVLVKAEAEAAQVSPGVPKPQARKAVVEGIKSAAEPGLEFARQGVDTAELR